MFSLDTVSELNEWMNEKKEKKCNKHIKKNTQIKITRFIFIVCVCLYVCMFVCFSCVSILTNMKIKTNKWNNNNEESEKWNEMRRRKTNKKQTTTNIDKYEEWRKKKMFVTKERKTESIINCHHIFFHSLLSWLSSSIFFPWIHKMLISSTGINSLGKQNKKKGFSLVGSKDQKNYESYW